MIWANSQIQVEIKLLSLYMKKQSGRKNKEQYYKDKKLDSVNIQENIIFLPISPDDYIHNPNIDMHIKISNTLSLLPYENTENYYSKVKEKKQVEFTIPEPVYKDSTKELYNIKIEPSVKNDICCWWCCHSFDNEPVFLPTKLYKEQYKVTGNFCSFRCCYSYMKNDRKYSGSMYLLNYMFKDITKKKGSILDYITPAPPRESLQMFGGMLDIEEFRKSDFTYSINPYPMNCIPIQIEKRTVVKENKFFKISPPSQTIRKSVELPANSLGKILKIKQV